MDVLLFRQMVRTTVRADARMSRIGVFLFPVIITMGSELGPAGPKNEKSAFGEYIFIWRKMISQMEISIWLIIFLEFHFIWLIIFHQMK